MGGKNLKVGNMEESKREGKSSVRSSLRSRLWIGVSWVSVSYKHQERGKVREQQVEASHVSSEYG